MLIGIVDYLLCYLCDTEEGSSGSPLVKTMPNGHRHVIALHRGSFKLHANGNNYNYGSLMSAIIDHIQGKKPNYCECYTNYTLSCYLWFCFTVCGEDAIVKKITDAGIPI